MSWLATFEISSAWLLIPLLLAVIAFDLRLMKIPNALVALFVVLFVASAPGSLPVDALLWQILAAFCVLAFGILAFAARVMGGGDAKVLAALTLLIPTHLLAQFALILAVCLLIGIVLLSITREKFANYNSGWKCLHDRRRYPMGLSIGMAGLALMYVGPNIPPAF